MTAFSLLLPAIEHNAEANAEAETANRSIDLDADRGHLRPQVGPKEADHNLLNNDGPTDHNLIDHIGSNIYNHDNHKGLRQHRPQDHEEHRQLQVDLC